MFAKAKDILKFEDTHKKGNADLAMASFKKKTNKVLYSLYTL